MPTMNWYDLPAETDKNFAVGDSVKVYVEHGRGASESWTKVLAVLGDGWFLVRPTFFTGEQIDSPLREAGVVFEQSDGTLVHKVHADDLKSEARARHESMLYHEEEYRAGCL